MGIFTASKDRERIETLKRAQVQEEQAEIKSRLDNCNREIAAYRMRVSAITDERQRLSGRSDPAVQAKEVLEAHATRTAAERTNLRNKLGEAERELLDARSATGIKDQKDRDRMQAELDDIVARGNALAAMLDREERARLELRHATRQVAVLEERAAAKGKKFEDAMHAAEQQRQADADRLIALDAEWERVYEEPIRRLAEIQAVLAEHIRKHGRL